MLMYSFRKIKGHDMKCRKHLRRKDAKKQKRIIVFCLLAALLCLSIGCAVFIYGRKEEGSINYTKLNSMLVKMLQ